MIALLLALYFGGAASATPEPAPACTEYGWPFSWEPRDVAACRAQCHWWGKAEQRCRDTDVEVIGSFDVRPAPHEWRSNAYVAPPPAWGAYPTERAVPASFP